MLYEAYQAQQDAMAPFRAAAELTHAALSDTCAGPIANYWLRGAAAGADIFSHAHTVHERPAYDIAPVKLAGRKRAIESFSWPAIAQQTSELYRSLIVRS